MNKPWPPPAPDASRHFKQVAEAGLKEPVRGAIVSPAIWNSQREASRQQDTSAVPRLNGNAAGTAQKTVVNRARLERIEKMERRSPSWPPHAPALSKDFKQAVEAKEAPRSASPQETQKSQKDALELQNKRTAPQLNLNPPGMRRPLIVNRAQRERIERMEQRSLSLPLPAPTMSRTFEQTSSVRQKEGPRAMSAQRTVGTNWQEPVKQQDKRPTPQQNLNHPGIRRDVGENLAKRERIQKMEERLMKDKARKDFGRSAGRSL